MSLYGFLAPVQHGGDLFGGVTLSDQLQDLSLARRQGKSCAQLGPITFCDRPETAPVISQDVRGNRRTQVGVPPGYGLDRLLELGRGGVLEEIAGGAGTQGLHGILLVEM